VNSVSLARRCCRFSTKRRVAAPLRLARVAAAIAAAGILFVASARATTIERVISPGGIEAWLTLAEAVGLARAQVESLAEVLPGVRFA